MTRPAHCSLTFAARAGLVTGFEDAVAAVASETAPPVRAGAPTLASTCEQYANALAPLVPVAMVDRKGRTLAEATELVAHLANALVQSAAESKNDDLGFGVEELVTVTLGPLLEPLDEQRGKDVLANITPALEAVEVAAAAEAQSGAIRELLQRCLESRMASFRYCAACGKSEPCRLMACGRCKQVRYCSQACQRGDWASHKVRCGIAQT